MTTRIEMETLLDSILGGGRVVGEPAMTTLSAIRAALAERDELKAWKEKYIKWAQEVLAYPRMAERLILLRKLSVGENIE